MPWTSGTHHLPLTSLRARFHAFGLFDGFIDPADVHERTFRQLVVLSVANLLEAADRFRQGGYLTGLVRKRFGDDERLRQEALNSTGPGHDLFVLIAQFLDPENGDDVLELAIALQN